MRRLILALALSLWLVVVCQAGVRLEPATIRPGEAFAVVFEEARLALVRQDSEIAMATLKAGVGQVLLAKGLKTQAGRYPVEIVWLDETLKTHRQTLWLTVDKDDRPEERLTLPERMVSPRKKSVLKRIKREAKQLRAIYERRSWPAKAQSFSLPVPQEISSVFGLKRILNGKPRSPHSGTDFRSPRGTVVRAPADGIVVLTADLFYTGRTVVLDHGDGLVSLYAHLSTFGCVVGQHLARGDSLGQVGSTGRSTGPHLHWGVRLRGIRVDPMSLVYSSLERP